MKMSLGGFELSVDVEKTKEFYDEWHLITKDCGCPSCRNYVQYTSQFPKEVKKFWETLGIDITKEAEIMIPYKHNDFLHYSGFYHLVGEITKCENQNEMIHITDNFTVGFSSECKLVPKIFPRPVMEVHFETSIPWILNEKCDY